MDHIHINFGQSIKLDWDFNNCQTIKLNTYEPVYDSDYENVYEFQDNDEFYARLIDSQPVPRIGSKTIQPSKTLFYQIQALNYLGKEVKKTIKINLNDVPELHSITPSSWNSSLGPTVALTGRNFDPFPASNIVEFQGSGGVRLSGNIVSASYNELIVEVPAAALSGPVDVTVGDLTTDPVNFQINQINNFIPIEADINPLYDQHQEAGSFNHKGKAFIVGGFTELASIYDGDTGIPNSIDGLSGSRSGFPVVRKVGDAAYAIGGNDEYNITQRYVEKYDLVTGNWLVLGFDALFPTGINGTNRCGSEFGTDIYFFADGETLKFDTLTETWSGGLAPHPTSPLFCKAVTYNNEIYVLGSGANNKDIHKYNPNTDTWTQLASSPQSLIGSAVSELNGFLVTTGGRIDNSLIQTYDPNTNTWKSSFLGQLLPLSPTASKFDHVSEVLNGELYLFGGNNKKVIKLIPV